MLESEALVSLGVKMD